MLRWFTNLSTRRKIVLVLAGGMASLLFDALVAHMSWSRYTMSWKQWIPVVYGAIATVALLVTALFPLRVKTFDRTNQIVGVIGLVIGLVGVFLHLGAVLEGLEGETLTISTIGKTLKLSAPLFAPAAFAGVGLFMVALCKIVPDPRAGTKAYF